MTEQTPLVTTPTQVDRSRTCILAAKQAYNELAKTVDWFESQPDEPDVRIHCLFARLYLYDTKNWINTSTLGLDSDFLKLFIAQFIDGYFKQVVDVVRRGDDVDNSQWKKYFKRTEKLTMRSNIFSHLAVVITAFYEHICHGIPDALYQSARDYEDLFGHPIDLSANRSLYIDPSNRDIFLTALLEFMVYHQKHQSTFRSLMLACFANLVRMTTRIWWPILNGWRRSSWESFEKRITQHSIE